MSQFTETATESPTDISEQIETSVVACMGTTACRRVCQYVDCEMVASPIESAEAFVYERNCGVLDTIHEQKPVVVKELLPTVQLPELTSLSRDTLVKETAHYLEYLRDKANAFETYLQSILNGKDQPRFVLAEAAKTYKRTEDYDYIYKPFADDEKETLFSFHGVLRGFHDMHTLRESGLLFDSAMEVLFIEAAREIGIGHHIKLVGEPGIAKTTFAKYLALQNAKAHHPDKSVTELTPIVISFSSTSEAEAQISEHTFEQGNLGLKFGKIAHAMKEGIGVVLDEQNGLTADQQTFFNDLFLKKPGQEVTINDETFVVANGFCIIATLNPMTDTQGNRRHGRQQQDSANAARFSRIDFKYPYQKGYKGNPDEAITRLFMAQYVDGFGWQMPSAEVTSLLTDTRELMSRLTKKATEPTEDGRTASVTNAQARPDLAECISPRDLSRILEVSLGYGDVDSAVAMIRQQIREKVQHILNSDNGHFVTPFTKKAVEELLRETKFNA